jgi:hypothetical protein
MTLGIKTHGFTTGNFTLRAVANDTLASVRRANNHILELNNTAIVLIRNPFKAIIGHRHLDSGGHTGFAKESEFLGPGWDYFVLVKIRSWEYFYMDWLTSVPDLSKILVINYEDLKDDLENILIQILDFLDFSTDKDRLSCVLEYKEAHKFKRKSKPDLPGDRYTCDQKITIIDAINRVDSALEEATKTRIPFEKYDVLL